MSWYRVLARTWGDVGAPPGADEKMDAFEGGLPMTLQIGMLGTDGFAIVGDTWKWLPERARSWWGYSGPKMILSPSGNSLGAVARNVEVAFEAVKEVFSQLEGYPGRKDEQIYEIASRIGRDHDLELLVAFTDPRPEMYVFVKEKNGPAKCEPLYSCYPIGDAGNPAYYWVLRNCQAPLRVQQLVRVGAVAVITAGKLNPSTIQGLEIASFDQRGLRIWECEESAALKAEIEDIDQRFSEILLQGPSNTLKGEADGENYL
jgi:hypothetical protein